MRSFDALVDGLSLELLTVIKWKFSPRVKVNVNCCIVILTVVI